MNAIPLTRTWTLRAATMDDLEAMVAMANAAARVTLGHDEFDVASYRGEWEDPGLSLSDDVRLAVTPDGEVVGCLEVWHREPFVSAWLWWRVHPEWCGQGIGAALMTWGEGRVREQTDCAPEGTRVAMSTRAWQSDEATPGLFHDLGFQPVRVSWRMARALDDGVEAPVWPEGITLSHPEVEADFAALYRADQEAFQDHWGNVPEPFESGFARFQARISSNPHFDPTLWVMAMDGDEVAGLSLCDLRAHDDPEMGWVDVLAVRRPWRKRGLGLALLRHSFQELHARGQTRVGLSVDSANLTGATRLYERAGMRVVRELQSYEKELRAGEDLAQRGN